MVFEHRQLGASYQAAVFSIYDPRPKQDIELPWVLTPFLGEAPAYQSMVGCPGWSIIAFDVSDTPYADTDQSKHRP